MFFKNGDLGFSQKSDESEVLVEDNEDEGCLSSLQYAPSCDVSSFVGVAEA